MSSLVLVGAQWGDEGKGKVTDYLAEGADAVVRYQGGGNAGHTLVVGDQTYKLHLVPSGVLRPGKECILGNGVVIDLEDLAAELDELERRNVRGFRLLVSSSAHLILPYHRMEDEIEEERKGADRIGTTGKGIGPAYRDKINRIGIRLGDCARPEILRLKLDVVRRQKAPSIDVDAIDWDALARRTLELYERLRSYIGDAARRVDDLLESNRRVLFEGAQGTFLDIDHGTYPYVTSSTPTAGGACVGSGVGPSKIDAVIGVTKAYSTRVGAGPFPTELKGELGELFVARGNEFGSTTGRTRRCGWLDLVALRRSRRINGLRGFALTKLDVLDAFETIRVCVAYRVPDLTAYGSYGRGADDSAGSASAGHATTGSASAGHVTTGGASAGHVTTGSATAGCASTSHGAAGEGPAREGPARGTVVEEFPSEPWMLDDVEPIYEEMPGWCEPTDGVETWEQLPPRARAFIEKIERVAGAPVEMISVGAARTRTVERVDPWRRVG